MNTQEPTSLLHKVAIELIGTLCTGKTTIGTLLSEKFQWPFFSIDTFRKEHGNETVAWQSMSEHVNDTNFIFEHSGLSVRSAGLLAKIRLSNITLFTVRLEANEESILERLSKRELDEYEWPPGIFNENKPEAALQMLQSLQYKQVQLSINTSEYSTIQCVNIIAHNLIR